MIVVVSTFISSNSVKKTSTHNLQEQGYRVRRRRKEQAYRNHKTKSCRTLSVLRVRKRFPLSLHVLLMPTLTHPSLRPSAPPSLSCRRANSDRSSIPLGRARHNPSRVLAQKSTCATTTRLPASILADQKRRSSTSEKTRSASGTAADWTSQRYGLMVTV